VGSIYARKYFTRYGKGDHLDVLKHFVKGKTSKLNRIYVLDDAGMKNVDISM